MIIQGKSQLGVKPGSHEPCKHKCKRKEKHIIVNKGNSNASANLMQGMENYHFFAYAFAFRKSEVGLKKMQAQMQAKRDPVCHLGNDLIEFAYLSFLAFAFYVNVACICLLCVNQT